MKIDRVTCAITNKTRVYGTVGEGRNKLMAWIWSSWNPPSVIYHRVRCTGIKGLLGFKTTIQRPSDEEIYDLFEEACAEDVKKLAGIFASSETR